MKYNYGFCGDSLTIEQIVLGLEDKLRVRLMAREIDDVVHGYINFMKVPSEINQGECWCGENIANVRTNHYCVEIVFYDQDKDPEFVKHIKTGKIVQNDRGLDKVVEHRTKFRFKNINDDELHRSLEKIAIDNNLSIRKSK